jgi:NADPH2:quinone reductase
LGINQPGTFAQRVAVPAESLVEIPAGWTEPEAAGATLVYLTAYQALTMWGPLPPSAVVLVTGASGGVGVAAVQLAAAMGYKVVALSRSPEKSRRLEQLGASVTFTPEDSKWSLALKNNLGPRRVDLAIDNVGGNLLPQVISTLGDQGRVSLVGRLAGPVPNFNTATLFFRRNRLGGVAASAWTNAESHVAWQEILNLLARAGARPQVDKVFPFDQLPQAFDRLAHGPMGKVLVAVRPAGA